MSLDPQTVREIAREHIRSGRGDIGTSIVKHFGNGALGDEEYVDWYHAVIQAWRIELRAVSWPDEQQQADPVTAGQQQDGAVGRVERFLDAREARGDARNGGTISVVHADGSRTGEGPGMYRRPLTDADLRAVLAERTALAARVAELEREREADTRAVAAVLKLGEVLYLGQRPTDWTDARRGLKARVAEGIAALDAIQDGGAK